MSLVAHKKVYPLSKYDVFSAVEEVMVSASWKRYVWGDVFVKVNLLSDKVIPGLCTSPWVLEGVLRVLSSRAKSVVVGDADVATTRQIASGSVAWGYKKMCKEYGARFVNLSKFPLVGKKGFGHLGVIEFPEPLVRADSIVSLPVPKTHNVSMMTGALKNQWGAIPRYRHRYHDRVQEVIGEINNALGVSFAVADATVCMEGEGPRTGVPKAVNSVLASHDLVALDAALAHLMGFSLSELPFINHAAQLGVGSVDYEVVGDPLLPVPFARSDIKNHPVVHVEMVLRKYGATSLFNSSFFKVPAAFATFYNTVWWHVFKGRPAARDFLKGHPVYAEEFAHIVN